MFVRLDIWVGGASRNRINGMDTFVNFCRCEGASFRASYGVLDFFSFSFVGSQKGRKIVV